MKNNKTLLPPLYYHTPPQLSSPIFRLLATLKIISKISENWGGNLPTGSARLGRAGGYLAKPLFIYILQLQKRPYKKQALYTSIQAYIYTEIVISQNLHRVLIPPPWGSQRGSPEETHHTTLPPPSTPR